MSTPEPRYDPFNEDDDRDYIRCSWCDLWLVDGEGERIGRAYGHPACAREQEAALAHGLLRELAADERRDGK